MIGSVGLVNDGNGNFAATGVTVDKKDCALSHGLPFALNLTRRGLQAGGNVGAGEGTYFL